MRDVRRLAAPLLGVALLVAACGGSDAVSSDGAGDPSSGSMIVDSVPADRTLSGIVRDPPPVVDVTPLPSLSEPGSDVAFRARPGGLLVVYFGFTNCPDVCPTTLFDLTVALRMLPTEQADVVDVLMVTVDPDRDLDLLPGYVRSFVPDAEAAGTPDDSVLMAAAAPFGVTYEVRTLADGTVEVDHTPFLYVVDDRGELVLTWQFGAPSEAMAADLFQLLEDRGSA